MNSELPDPPAENKHSAPIESATPAVTFESLTFSDGTTIALDPNDTVVLVGPNNAGKSAALRELEQHIGPEIEQTVIKAASLIKSGTADQLRTLLLQHGRKIGAANNTSYAGFRYNLSVQNLESYWKNNID
jgi:ATPase subunit of ABC transporter with duplicated ATPase domains